MKLFLFGGAKAHDGHADIEPLLKLIEATIRKTWVRQIFHIPYARTIATEPERDGDWFNRNIHIEGLEYLNASNPDDISKVDKPLILLSGGGKSFNLLQKLYESPELITLIKNADYIVGESAGVEVLCSHLKFRLPEGGITVIEWLWILPDTIIEPHYKEFHREAALEKEMQEAHTHYGIGIDSDTGIEIDLATFPKYSKIGDGVVEIKTDSTK